MWHVDFDYVITKEVKMIRLRKLFLVIVVILLMTTICHAREIAGVEMPDSLTIGENTVFLNGGGPRTKLFLDFYVGGLYLLKPSNDPREIIAADEAMAIRLQVVSSMITSEKMAKATKKGFKKTGGINIVAIESRIEKFIAVFYEKINKHDIFDLLYVPGQGLEIYKNSEKYSLIEGLDFKQALFGIWLSDYPAQKSLKKQMLGQ